jgi:hypothetical protein
VVSRLRGRRGRKWDTACTVVDGWMKSVKSNGRVEVPRKVLELANRDFTAERVSDDQVGAFIIRRIVGIGWMTYTDTRDDTEVLRIGTLLHR